MAPVMHKRRRGDDEERRPKKKFKKVKKQDVYHSSSEDDDDEPTQQRASDAPRGMPKRTMSLKKATGANDTEVKSRPTPKSILKQAAPKPQPPSDSGDESEDEDDNIQITELEKNTALNSLQPDEVASDDDLDENDEPDVGDSADDSEPEEDEDEDDIPSESEASITSSQARLKKKRNDPSAFATSISKILDTKLSTSKRSDPVLSRSKSAAEANASLADSKLEAKARAQIRAEKRAVSERGHVKDVLGLDTPDANTGAIVEEEKRLKKTAQRGVVKLFNAVRAAQVKAEEATRQAREQGVVGMGKREERVNEMSKKGFLDLISSGGKMGTQPVEA